MNYQKASHVEAHVTKNKSRLKLYAPNKVFLNDKESFEIELFNPTSDDVLVKIKVNDHFIGSGGIVLRPAERIHLERFLDSNNKFVFSTYEVEDNSTADVAIQKNGLIEVFFYKRRYFYPNYYSTSISWDTGDVGYRSGTITTTQNINFTDTGITMDSCDDGNIISACCNSINEPVPEFKETGKIEKGDVSDQGFETVNKDFESNYFKRELIQILPVSEQVKYKQDFRLYCSGCGKKTKKNDKYCSKCGIKIK